MMLRSDGRGGFEKNGTECMNYYNKNIHLDAEKCVCAIIWRNGRGMNE